MKKKFYNFKSIFPIFLCLLFIALQVVILNYDSTSGRAYEKISIELQSLETSNSILSQQVASSSSMIAIASKAQILGFSGKKSVVSLYGPQPLAAIANTL